LKRSLEAQFPGIEVFEERFGVELIEVMGLSEANINDFGAVGSLAAVPQARDESDPVGPLARLITAMSRRSHLALWLAEPLHPFIRNLKGCSIRSQVFSSAGHGF
jgi:hypothetical protein